MLLRLISPTLLPLLAVLTSTTTSALPTTNSTTSSLLSKRQGVNLGFPYGSSQVRGVNLGGWLLLEPFISPSMFEGLDGSIVDEYTFCQNQDRGEAEGRLRGHWESWVTEDDFRQIAAAGLSEWDEVGRGRGWWGVPLK